MPDINAILRLLDREIWLVTAGTPEQPAGLIATFVNSASIVPDMPRMLVGIARQHYTWQRIEASRAFVLHLLDETHLDWVWRFGLQSGHAIDKFADLTMIRTPIGCPRLPGVVAWLECRVESSLDTGDRTIYLAEVQNACLEATGPPLTMKRVLERAPAERMRELREGMARDSAVDAAAIDAWRRGR